MAKKLETTPLILTAVAGATPEQEREARICSIALHLVLTTYALTPPETEEEGKTLLADHLLRLCGKLMELYPDGGFAMLQDTLDHAKARGLHVAPWLECEVLQ